MVKNLLSSARDVDSIPGLEIKMPHAVGQLRPCSAAREACVAQQHIYTYIYIYIYIYIYVRAQLYKYFETKDYTLNDAYYGCFTHLGLSP